MFQKLHELRNAGGTAASTQPTRSCWCDGAERRRDYLMELTFPERMKQSDEPPPTGLANVLKALSYSTTLFVAFISFGAWMYNLKCGYWCNVFFGSA